MDKMTIYNNLPIWGQNLACYVEGKRIRNTRYGRLFEEKLIEYQRRGAWSYEQKCEYRDAQLRKMIGHCYATVPHYKEIFDAGNINPDSIRHIDDLQRLPILTKEEVNKNPEKFISSVISKNNMQTAHTSGTTGAGFVFKTTQEAICNQWAVWWRYREALGIKFGTLSANFGTRFVVPAKQKKPPFWRYNYPCNQVYFSAFHEKPEYLKYYVEEIKRKKIIWLHGYPSLLSELADEVIREDDSSLNNQIMYITIGAENLLDYQKSVIERAFGVHVYQHYGLSEGVSNFSENKDGQIVVDEDFAATEFVTQNGITQIIGTNLTNYAMPLIRWRTNDTAEFHEDKKVGRIVDSLDGRIEDYITLPSGKKIGKLDHVFKDAVHLKEVQIVQNKDYSINVLYVPSSNEYNEDLKKANELFDQTFGEKVSVIFQRVDEIKKTKSGKIRFIVSEL